MKVKSHSGKEIILGMVNPGEIFGEMALVDKGPRDTVAEVIMDSYVCFKVTNLKRDSVG